MSYSFLVYTCKMCILRSNNPDCIVVVRTIMKSNRLFSLRIVFIALLFIIQITYCNAAGNVIDSLKVSLAKTKTKHQRMNILLKLSQQATDSDKRLALEYAEGAMLLARELQTDTLNDQVLLNLAWVNLLIGNYPRALDLYQQATKSKSIGANDLLRAYNGIGIINYYQRDYKSAVEAYNKALSYASSTSSDSKSKKALSQKLFNNLGILYEEMKDYAKSNYFYNESLKLSRQIDDKTTIAHALTNHGRLFHKLGKDELALQYYLEALEIRQKRNDRAGVALSYDGLGEFYFELKNYTVAEKYLKEAIEIAKQTGDLLTVKRSSANLYKLYEKQERYKLAFNALMLNKQASDSLFNDERANKIRQLKSEFEFERKENEEKAKRRERELTYLLIGGGLLMSLIILGLLFYLQRNKVRNSLLEQAHLKLEKDNLEKDIELKDKELTTSTMHLMQKNELIDHISDKLHKIKQTMDGESQQLIQRVITDLQSNLRPELLKEFEFRFQQVHEEFYDVLNTRFPNLTPSERKLCAFLKLGMTTKEISAITHQNIKAIEIARTRLRKKLNLTNQDYNLVTFLTQLS